MMHWIRHVPRLLLVAATLGLLLTMPPRTARAQEPVPAPTGLPDAARGLTLYAARCANCHGPQGRGDGEMAARLPAPPRAFVDPAFLRAAVPASIFRTLTNGNLEQGMPPFGPLSSNPIAEDSRWDLIAAVYSLGTPQASIERGQILYQALDPAPELAFLEDPAFWRDNSNQAAFDRLADLLPDLAEDDRWSLVDYGRTFSYAYATAAAAAPAPAPAALLNGLVRGQVTNGTSGQATEGLSALLRAFDPNTFTLADTYTTTVAADGAYAFALDEVPSHWVYMTTIGHEGINFSSDVGQLSEAAPEAVLDVTVYDSTSDGSVIQLERLHIIAAVEGDLLQISQLYSFSNLSDRVYVGDSGDPAGGTVRVALPAEAQNPDFQRGFGTLDSFVPTNELFPIADGWQDTVPLRPGRGVMNLLATFVVPYEPGMSLSQRLFYDTNVMSVVMPDVGVRLTGDWLEGTAMSGESGDILQYSAEPQPAGSQMVLTFTGRPRAVAPPTAGGNTELIVGAGVLVLAVAVLATVRLRQNAFAAEAEEREALLADIADLDDAFAAGEVDEATYRSERQILKEMLLAAWDDERA